ncbi:hypothetical protein QZH41_010370 [Actinostola sp. cb2023]|nr:hypothetical protein QZH41_010370 [Actinostola sp. cb2023]
MGYVAIVATLFVVLFFQLGPGPIPWFITTELFTQGPRPAACAISAAVNWFTNFLVGVGFPAMQQSFYPYTYIVFIVLNIGFWLFVFFFVPETKGRSIEEISSHFKNRANNGYAYSPIGSTHTMATN